MSFTRAQARTAAIAVAQDAVTSDPSVQLLLTSPGDYSEAIDQTIRNYELDRPNQRVVHHTIATAAFRYVLFGAGAISSLDGLDAWAHRFSVLMKVWTPYDTAVQSRQPLDDNNWQVIDEPGPMVVLELLSTSGVIGEILRLEFSRPHTLTDEADTVAKPSAPVGALVSPAVAGDVDDGTHSFRATYVTGSGETEKSDTSNVVTVADKSVNGKARVTVENSPDAGVLSKNIYMTEAGNAGDDKLAGAIPNNATTGITINVADSALGAVAPTANTAGGTNTIPDVHQNAITMLGASFILQMAATRAVQNMGSTGLPNDVVDRRSPADVMRSLAKELRASYDNIMGKGEVRGTSAWLDMDIGTSHRKGMLWHPTTRR